MRREKKRIAPRATYRVQLSSRCTLKELICHLGYFERLGISHLYLSPLLAAAPGSPHGYDVVDFNRINPEIGSEEQLEKLAAELHKREMGILLDFVPNHMCVTSPENRWWWSLLKEGQESPYAPFFDVDWSRGKIILPFLAEPVEQARKLGKLTVEEFHGEEVLCYGPMRFPADDTHYELHSWCEGEPLVNYRRFFNISSLAALCMHNDQVFRECHKKIYEWIENGWIEGLRIDHIDGLKDPESYLKRLRSDHPHLYLIVEKILLGKEQIPKSWPVDGTSGYDFIPLSSHLFIEQKAKEQLTHLYRSFTGDSKSFAEHAREAKLQLLERELAPEFRRLLDCACKRLGDFTQEVIDCALKTLLLALPHYRTYLPREGGELWKETLARAMQLCPEIEGKVWKALDQLFLSGDEGNECVQRFELLSAPLMAKGVEDTTFYRYTPLLALNEVGCEPEGEGHTLGSFHSENAKEERLTTLLATSTHDTKRSEDVRARLLALFGMQTEWEELLLQLSHHNKKHKSWQMPSKCDEYLFYQTVVGSCPYPAPTGKQLQNYKKRMQAFMQKAICEAKRESSWHSHNAPYEEATSLFVEQALMTQESPTVKKLGHFLKQLHQRGALISIVQTLLKITLPGIPDFYQGTEILSYTLVDPDNREPIDFSEMDKQLEVLGKRDPKNLTLSQIKHLIAHRALQCRKEHSCLFSRGEYLPIESAGNCIAFGRRLGRKSLYVVCSRDAKSPSHCEEQCKKCLSIPSGLYKDALFGREVQVRESGLQIEELTTEFDQMEKLPLIAALLLS